MALKKILSFISDIGIIIHEQTFHVNTFLPGILIHNGSMVMDREKLLYPGDLLHEAGHIAVMPPRIRRSMNANLDMEPIHQAGELMAIAWSYAACLFLNVDPHVVFHEHGYKGGGKEILENFNHGRYFGVPLMAWQEMTFEVHNCPPDAKPFPHMQSWLCQVDKYAEASNSATLAGA